MDFLGWYSTGDRPTLADIDIHRQITDINESPLFLQLSPGWLNDLFSRKLCVDHIINFSAVGIQSTCETDLYPTILSKIQRNFSKKDQYF
jgi:hypothetical protein